MKAYKGCVNRECKSFKRKDHYKDEYNYCPICGEKLEYVCADCWKVMEHSTERYCASCAAKREQKREQTIQKVKDLSKAVPVVAVSKYAWQHKGEIVDVASKIVKK